MSDNITVAVWIETNRVGSRQVREVVIDREEWDEMSDDDKDTMLHETMEDMLQWGWEVTSTFTRKERG